jgi:ribosome-binding factor A
MQFPPRLIELLLLLLLSLVLRIQAFLPTHPVGHSCRTAPSSSQLNAGVSRSSDRSKRQERVGHLVRTELSTIIHSGHLIKPPRQSSSSSLDTNSVPGTLNADLRQRISVVSADVSPDLKQARVAVSISATPKVVTAGSSSSATASSTAAAIDKRRAYSWLVKNTKPIRHALAQRLSHMKGCPELTFLQVDVAAAVDVMYLIDKVSKGYKRTDLYGDSGSSTDAFLSESSVDEDDDDDEWEDEDEDFF